MACAGLKACESEINKKQKDLNASERLVNLALDMKRQVGNVTWGGLNKRRKIEVTIGIHSGTVIAGIIGHHKPQFSLIGDSVNTTSRVCSTGKSGSITLSQKSFSQINSNQYIFEETNGVQVIY